MDDFADETTPTRPLDRSTEPTYNHSTATYQDKRSPTPTLPAPPTAARIHAAIMHAAERQVATSMLAQTMLAIVGRRQLFELLEQIAANAANPIADMIEDTISGAST